MSLLDVDELLAYFDHYRSAFRAEFRSDYLVVTDENAAGVSDFQRWLAGAESPDAERKGGVLQDLRDELADGRRLYRVKVMHAPPTDYERYAAEWGYAYNVEAGEEVHIWDLAKRPLPAEARDLRDFWLFNGESVLVMHYDEHGRYEGAELADPVDLPHYLAARDALLAGAEEFRQWWAAHPELRRRGAAA
jgi:hypothetical protein